MSFITLQCGHILNTQHLVTVQKGVRRRELPSHTFPAIVYCLSTGATRLEVFDTEEDRDARFGQVRSQLVRIP